MRSGSRTGRAAMCRCSPRDSPLGRILNLAVSSARAAVGFGARPFQPISAGGMRASQERWCFGTPMIVVTEVVKCL